MAFEAKIKDDENEQGVWFDFALIELDEIVDFEKFPHIRPICLPLPSNEVDYDKPATVSGWGFQHISYNKDTLRGLVKGKGYKLADKLQKLDVR